MANLTRKEINKLLDKIRNKFEEYAGKYGKNKFDVEKFNERYVNALKTKVNIENFLYAEITALEELVADIKNIKNEKLEEIKQRKKIRKQLNDIAEEYSKKIESYPDFVFNDKTPYEISKIFGALKLYYKELFHEVESIVKSYNDLKLNNEFKYFKNKFDDYCYEKKQGVTGKSEDFVLIIERFNKNEKEFERYIQKFMQEIGIFLNSYTKFLIFLINKVFNRDEFIKQKKFFNANLDFITKIVNDFRISAFNKENKIGLNFSWNKK